MKKVIPWVVFVVSSAIAALSGEFVTADIMHKLDTKDSEDITESEE